MSLTFIHTADWQLGKPFGRIPDLQKRTLVQQERLNVIERIRQAAVEQSAALIVIAGDLFDSPTPAHATISAACSAIGRFDIPVYALPGNHDHGGPGSIWEQEFFLREKEKLAPNLTVLLSPEPVDTGTAVLFPCPLLRRAESADPTAWLRTLTPETLEPFGSKPRVVIAHGSVQEFGARIEPEEGVTDTANRIDLSSLPLELFDYIALGDWHGAKEISARAWYAGTPELDRFPKGDSHHPGKVLGVSVSRGALPRVQVISTARLQWRTLEWEFHDDGSLSRFEEEMTKQIDTRTGEDLLKLDLSGALGITAMTKLERLLESLEARLLRLEVSHGVVVVPSQEEIDALTRRTGDPLISRVASTLLEATREETEAAAVARIALRELHAACIQL